MNNNIITIVTPSYNQGQFIETTIESVLSQRGDFYLEYIIADGGSTDITVKIIKKFDELLKSNQYPIKCKGIDFKWWSKSDKGQSDAINQGFKLAKGDILAWINSDDYYEPDAFNTVINTFKENGVVDLVYGNGNCVNEKGDIIDKIIPKIGNYETFLKRGWMIFQPSAFFSKSIIKKVDYLDESLHYAMDFDLCLKILKAGKVKYIPTTLANFRKWGQTKTNSEPKKFILERQVIFKRHNGNNKIDPKKLYNLLYNLKIFKLLKYKMSFIYNFLKKIFYFFIDRINFKKKNL